MFTRILWLSRYSHRSSWRFPLLTATVTMLGACRPDGSLAKFGLFDAGPSGDLSAGSASDRGPGPRDLGGMDMRRDMAKDMGPQPNPPPTSCYQRKPGFTAIQALVKIDAYKGLYTGRSGTHENAEITVSAVTWVYEGKALDTTNATLAMLVDTGEGAGLPMELPLVPGQVIEVEGEFIPASLANAQTKNGPAAVIHFTHSPCGYAVIDGATYK